jgi:hypothetical protein
VDLLDSGSRSRSKSCNNRVDSMWFHSIVNRCSLEFDTGDGISEVGLRWRLVEGLIFLRSRRLLHTFFHAASDCFVSL